MSNISLSSDTEVVKYNGLECNAVTLDGQLIWERPNYVPELPRLGWAKTHHWLQSSSEAPESWKLAYEYGAGLVSDYDGVGYILQEPIYDDPIPELPQGVTASKIGTGLFINPGSRPYSNNLASFLLGIHGPDQWDWGFSLPVVYNHETYNTRLSTEQVKSDLVACVGGLAPSWAPFQGNGRNSGKPWLDFEAYPSIWGNNPFNRRDGSGAISPDRSTWKISGNDVIVAYNLQERPRDNIENRFHELKFSTNYLHYTNNYQDQGLDYYSRSYPVEYLLKNATDITKGYYRKVTYATAVKAKVDGSGSLTRYGPFSIKIELPTHEQLLDAGYGDFSKNGVYGDNYVNYDRIIVPLFSHPDTSQELRTLDSTGSAPEPAANGLYKSGLSDIIGFNPFTLSGYKEASSSYAFPYDIGDGVKQIVSASNFYGRPYQSSFTSPYSSVQAPALWTGTLTGKYKDRDGATQTITETADSFILNEAKIESSLSTTSTGIKVKIDSYLACSTYKYSVNDGPWSSSVSVTADANIALSGFDLYTVDIEAFEGASQVAKDTNSITYGELPTISSWTLEEEDAVFSIKDVSMSSDADAYVIAWHSSAVGYSGINEDFAYLDPRSLGFADIDISDDAEWIEYHDLHKNAVRNKDEDTIINLQYQDAEGKVLGPTTISISVYAARETSISFVAPGTSGTYITGPNGVVYAVNTDGIKKAKSIDTSGPLDAATANQLLLESLPFASFSFRLASVRSTTDTWFRLVGNSNGYINLFNQLNGRNYGYASARYDKDQIALNPWGSYFNNPVLTTDGVANMKAIYEANSLGEYDEDALRVWYYASFAATGYNLFSLWIAWIDEPKKGSNTVFSMCHNGFTGSSPFPSPGVGNMVSGWFKNSTVPQITPLSSCIINNTSGDFFNKGYAFIKGTHTIS